MFIRHRYPRAFAASALVHCLVAIAVLAGMRWSSARDPLERHQGADASQLDRVNLVWLRAPSRGRGGGGGGDSDPRPARRLEVRGSNRSERPDVRPRTTAVEATRIQRAHVVPRVNVPVLPSASALQDLPGTIVAVAPVTSSRGPGRDGIAGAGRNGGIGDGDGTGLDLGAGGNTGSGVRTPGGAVSDPILVHETKPAYTLEALRAGIQGLVVLDAVVLPNGRIGQVNIVRSLDARLGLDERALEAVRDWRFRPALMAGRPVPVLVRIELAFTLR